MNCPHTNRQHGTNLLLLIWLAVVPPGILIALYLNLPFYAFTLNTSILPKYFYFLFAVLLSPLLILNTKSFISYLVSPIALWAISFIVLNCVHLLADTEGSAQTSTIVLARIQVIGIMILLGFAFTKVRREVCGRIFVLLAVFLPCANIADFLFPGFFYPIDTPGVVVGRAAGTFINSNSAGEAILIMFILACPSVAKKYRPPLIILCGIGALLTFSRAAMGVWLVLFAYLIIRDKLPRVTALTALIVFSIPLLLGGMESYLRQRSDLGQSIENIEDRLSFLSKRKFVDDSAIERAAVLQAGWEALLRNPLTGIGAGATLHESSDWPYPVSAHNQLIFLGADYGIPGVLAWCWLGFCLMRGRYFQEKNYQRLIFLLFVAMTPFTHNMFDLPYWLFTFMLVAQRPARTGSVNDFPAASFPIKRMA